MNETALVTGAAKRVGRELALELSKHGYDLAIHYNKSEKQALELRQEILSSGGVAQVFQCDLGRPENIEQMCSQVIEKMSPWKILIHNASIFEADSFLETSIEHYFNNVNVHLSSPFFLSQQFAKQNERGNIISILDARITKNKTDHFSYLLTKKALTELTKMLALELAPLIRVNGIAPGAILPPGDQDDAFLKQRLKTVPMEQTGGSEAVVKAMNYILDNNKITGEILYIDGGESLL